MVKECFSPDEKAILLRESLKRFNGGAYLRLLEEGKKRVARAVAEGKAKRVPAEPDRLIFCIRNDALAIRSILFFRKWLHSIKWVYSIPRKWILKVTAKDVLISACERGIIDRKLLDELHVAEAVRDFGKQPHLYIGG